MQGKLVQTCVLKAATTALQRLRFHTLSALHGSIPGDERTASGWESIYLQGGCCGSQRSRTLHTLSALQTKSEVGAWQAVGKLHGCSC